MAAAAIAAVDDAAVDDAVVDDDDVVVVVGSSRSCGFAALSIVSVVVIDSVAENSMADNEVDMSNGCLVMCLNFLVASMSRSTILSSPS